MKKTSTKTKSENEQHDEFTKKVIGMRRGKQFDFVKMERPEPEDRADFRT